jgi:two-component system response regulator FlrC
MSPTLLIVDDEPAQRQLMRAVLENDYELVTAADGHEAKQLLERRTFDLVITDERMPNITGSELVAWAHEHLPEIPFIVLTAHGSIETAVQAIKLGATDYLSKPLGSPEELRLVVAKALKDRRLVDGTLAQQAEIEARFPADIVAESDAMKRVLTLAEQVAPQPTTVLLTGESGTGKEVVARFLHRRSQRSDMPFVPVNCAALTETLLESELFGHEKGAFTGATQSRRGRFELANGGTLFLDEVGEMGPNLQTKLLRVLQEQEFERVGGTRTISVDVRVIAATNRRPDEAVEAGDLRADLYYRLSVFPIDIPPLRLRKEDVLPLAEHFVAEISARMGQQPKHFSPEARERVCAHDWPGNVRELQNAVERSLIVSRDPEILASDLPLVPRGVQPLDSYPGGVTADATMDSPSLGGSTWGPLTLAEIEKRSILDALERHDGDRRATAEELGISLRTLQYRLKDYGLTKRG